jgi:hypothetical protein
MIEKNEGTHHAMSRERQHPTDLQPAAQIPPPAFDDQIEHSHLLAPQEAPTATAEGLFI